VGEASYAVATVYTRLADNRLLRCAKRALHRCEHLWRNGSVSSREFVFFANWQCQAAAAIVRHMTGKQELAALVQYAGELQVALMERVELMQLEEAATVEVACALEGLADACAVLLYAGVHAGQGRYERCSLVIATAVRHLQRVQSRGGGEEPEAAVGGYGHGLERGSVQRIDVSGHVTCAYIKLLNLMAEY
jgi:hypothetical protein